MKNKILLVVVFLTGLFLSITSVDALTVINFEEKSNGQLNTTIHFEEGFVGGIDITFNVVGDVSVTNVKFADAVVANSYNPKYSYDEKNHTLNIRITTGGVGTSHNLLNSKKEFNLGTIEFNSSAKEDVTYKLAETTFQIVDNNWASKTIAQEHITLGEKKEFVYKVTQTEQPPEEETPKEDDDKEDDNTKEDTTNKEDKEENQTTTNTDNKKPDSTNNNKDDNNKNDETDDNEDKDSSNSSNATDEVEENVTNPEPKKDNSAFKWLMISIVVIGIIVICASIYFFIIRKHNDNKE